MINAKLNLLKFILPLYSLRLSPFIALVISASLMGCEQQPKSMFEQQAEVNSANELTVTSEDETIIVAPVTTTAQSVTGEKANRAIKINKLQAVAHQPNCDDKTQVCQYFEVNVLEFTPEQPWLSSIMWKTVAQVLAPETPLASQDQAAKNTIIRLLKQIEYGNQVVETLPMYERIDTELVLHPIRFVDDMNDNNTPIAIGYLLVRTIKERGSSQQHLNYVMLDVQKKLQLTIEDILLPSISTDKLLLTFQNAKKDWLISQGVADKYLDDWPLHLSRQWYLDEQGLHMVYQSRELLEVDTDAVDLIVPYALLKGLIKPDYIVSKRVDYALG